MISKIKEFIFSHKHELYTYIISGLLSGFIFFILIYGTSVLNPTNVAWIYRDTGDLIQHQIGWEFFRNAAWNFPFGLYDTFSYPFNNSIVFTDSIPLFAIFFKAFRALLPENFQYLGLFGFICFGLQGMFVALILRKLKVKLGIVLCVLPLFFFNSILLLRMFRHTALGGGHALILAAILVWLYRKELTLKYKLIFYSVLCAISFSIHAYIFPMIYCFVLSDAVQDYISYKNKKRCLLILFMPVLSFLLVGFLLGAFSAHIGAKSLSLGGLGYYSMNLNALLNPIAGSKYLKILPYTSGQGEGVQYLGIGIFILIIMFLSYLNFDKFKQFIKTNKTLLLSISIIVVPLFLFALSPKITLGERVIVDYSNLIPSKILEIMSTFRSSGRFFWPVWYMILIGLIYFINNQEKNKIKLAIICILCSLIAYNESSNIPYNTKFVKQPYNEILYNEFSNIIDTTKAKHIAIFNTAIYAKPSVFATKHKMTLNNGYYGDPYKKTLQLDYADTLINGLQNGKINDDTIYIFSHKEKLLYLVLQQKLHDVYSLKIGEYFVLCDRKLLANKPSQSLIFNKNNADMSLSGSSLLTAINGKKHESGYIETLERSPSGFLAFGPYIKVLGGRYKLIINYSGENIDGSYVDIAYSKGTNIVKKKNLLSNQREVSMDFDLRENVNDLETRVFYGGKGKLRLNYIKIIPQETK